ncbi:hypothetical protein E3P77_01909 [Wallemia ichthyophaga]|nr:hypothetical protein E3P77_01909 [Wallemia ichthyophaga]
MSHLTDNAVDLPRLPIPSLDATCQRYLNSLQGLQSAQEHNQTKNAVDFFKNNEGPILDKKLRQYANDKYSYIEEFWDESYLNYSDSVVLALNPFFILEDDPTPSRGSQLMRASSLIISSLGFVHDLRCNLLEPDNVRGVPLDMSQYKRLFGTSRIPTQNGCVMRTKGDSKHIIIARKGQFYWFDVIDHENRPLFTEQDLHHNLKSIVDDADSNNSLDASGRSIGVLTTENRKIWSSNRDFLGKNTDNGKNIDMIDQALFVVCLDDITPETTSQLCDNMLCGTSHVKDGIQLGSCTNRWYDKLQIIVCQDGSAGINFEHSGVDGHTVLRYAADIYTELVLLFAKSINPVAPTLFQSKLSPYSKSAKGGAQPYPDHLAPPATAPQRLEWAYTNEIKLAIRFAETRLSDMICQNEAQVMEFPRYGKLFITKHGFSPDAFVQMAFQAAYYNLYGRTECTYEPAMTKAFAHGRTEAIRSVTPQAVQFVQSFNSDAPPGEKIAALRKACATHSALSRECSKGEGHDRHLYAMLRIAESEREKEQVAEKKNNTTNNTPPTPPKPSLYADPGYSLGTTDVLSTSNCGNPALRLFGFASTSASGFGIGYIVRDSSISLCVSSKHRQTNRFVETIQAYLVEVEQMLIGLHKEANQRSSWHEDEGDAYTSGFSFFDVPVDVQAERKKQVSNRNVGVTNFECDNVYVKENEQNNYLRPHLINSLASSTGSLASIASPIAVSDRFSCFWVSGEGLGLGLAATPALVCSSGSLEDLMRLSARKEARAVWPASSASSCARRFLAEDGLGRVLATLDSIRCSRRGSRHLLARVGGWVESSWPRRRVREEGPGYIQVALACGVMQRRALVGCVGVEDGVGEVRRGRERGGEERGVGGRRARRRGDVRREEPFEELVVPFLADGVQHGVANVVAGGVEAVLAVERGVLLESGPVVGGGGNDYAGCLFGGGCVGCVGCGVCVCHVWIEMDDEREREKRKTKARQGKWCHSPGIWNSSASASHRSLSGSMASVARKSGKMRSSL